MIKITKFINSLWREIKISIACWAGVGLMFMIATQLELSPAILPTPPELIEDNGETV